MVLWYSIKTAHKCQSRRFLRATRLYPEREKTFAFFLNRRSFICFPMFSSTAELNWLICDAKIEVVWDLIQAPRYQCLSKATSLVCLLQQVLTKSSTNHKHIVTGAQWPKSDQNCQIGWELWLHDLNTAAVLQCAVNPKSSAFSISTLN